jgi:uncharacterized protein (DUF1015 family)
MAEIRAFSGLRLNPAVAGLLDQLICPPYDVINAAQREALYARSPYNMVRLEYGKVFPDDGPGHNRDSRAVDDYRNWLKRGVLKPEGRPAIYINDHYFDYHGRHRRRGIMARVRLEPDGRRTILPHEHTVAGVKSDRLQLLRACRANFSPIFILYDDFSGEIGALLDCLTAVKPTVECRLPEGEEHRLWAVNDKKLEETANKVIGSQIAYIADGHHRYETCQAYREEQQALAGSSTGEESYCFMMMTLVPFSDPGLFVLPIHRMIKGLSSDSIGLVRDRLARYFHLSEMSARGSGRSDTYLEKAKAQIAVAGLLHDRLLICKFKDDTGLESLMPPNRSDGYRSLPVSLLHHIILEHVGDVISGAASITYTHDEDEALQSVDNGSCQLSFVLPPTPVGMIKAIADAGDRMPGKSTFFYPKLPTGLVINSLDN